MTWSRDLRKFHNALRIMHSLDHADLRTVIPSSDDWAQFREDPMWRFLRMTDQQVELVWMAIERRQPDELKEN